MGALIIAHPSAAAQPVLQAKGRRGRYPRIVASLDVWRHQKTTQAAEQASIERASRLPLPGAEPCTPQGWRQGFHHALPESEQAIIEAALSLLKTRLQSGPVVDSPQAFRDYLRLQLAGEQRELFAVAFLASNDQMIAFEVMFTGTLNQTSVYPREVVRAALAHGAAAVILAHNHPGGNAEPSRADIELTQKLQAALQLVDLQVLDHFIVTSVTCRSMAEMGLI